MKSEEQCAKLRAVSCLFKHIQHLAFSNTFSILLFYLLRPQESNSYIQTRLAICVTTSDEGCCVASEQNIVVLRVAWQNWRVCNYITPIRSFNYMYAHHVRLLYSCSYMHSNLFAISYSSIAGDSLSLLPSRSRRTK